MGFLGGITQGLSKFMDNPIVDGLQNVAGSGLLGPQAMAFAKASQAAEAGLDVLNGGSLTDAIASSGVIGGMGGSNPLAMIGGSGIDLSSIGGFAGGRGITDILGGQGGGLLAGLSGQGGSDLLGGLTGLMGQGEAGGQTNLLSSLTSLIGSGGQGGNLLSFAGGLS